MLSPHTPIIILDYEISIMAVWSVFWPLCVCVCGVCVTTHNIDTGLSETPVLLVKVLTFQFQYLQLGLEHRILL